MLVSPTTISSVLALCLGEYSLEEAIIESLNRSCDALDLYEIDAVTKDHFEAAFDLVLGFFESAFVSVFLVSVFFSDLESDLVSLLGLSASAAFL